jgi:uncharacterized protein (TIGR02231 family)
MRRSWLLPCIAIQLAAQSPIQVAAPIRKVRLHPDEAWVTRIGHVKLAAAGLHRLALADLPAGLSMDDVRIAAKAPQGSSLGDLSLAAEVRKVTETPEYKALKAECEGARDKVEALEAEGEALAQEQSFLKGIQASHDKELSGRLPFALPGPAAVVDLSKGIQGRLTEVLTRDRRRRHDLEKAREEARRLEQELRQRGAERNASPTRAVVEVQASRAGDVEVELSYRTRRARWDPGYEARLGEGGKVELVLFATVKQDTGEDWNGVQVEVTNARSGRSLTLARFAGPQVVTYSDAPPMAHKARMARAQSGAAVEVLAEMAPGVAAPAPAAQNTFVDAVEQESAPAEETEGIAATWSLEGSKEVPADDAPHKFRILSKTLDPELALVAVPRLDPTVYRVARFPVPGGLPLFPGAPVVHFAGTQRVGQAALELPAPGKPIQLGFGPFRGVRVGLQRVDARKEQAGTFTKDNQWVLKERLEVTNDTESPWEVEVQDRELKAGVDKVKITTQAEGAPAKEGPAPGVRAWTFKLGPKATGVLDLTTQVRVPQGGYVNGLGNLKLPE